MVDGAALQQGRLEKTKLSRRSLCRTMGTPSSRRSMWRLAHYHLLRLQLAALAILSQDGTARAQPEAPYPDTVGWLPLVYEKTADGYDNHDEHYLNKAECLPGSTVQLRGHIQCVSGNQEWCVLTDLLTPLPTTATQWLQRPPDVPPACRATVTRALAWCVMS